MSPFRLSTVFFRGVLVGLFFLSFVSAAGGSHSSRGKGKGRADTSHDTGGAGSSQQVYFYPDATSQAYDLTSNRQISTSLGITRDFANRPASQVFSYTAVLEFPTHWEGGTVDLTEHGPGAYMSDSQFAAFVEHAYMQMVILADAANIQQQSIPGVVTGIGYRNHMILASSVKGSLHDINDAMRDKQGIKTPGSITQYLRSTFSEPRPGGRSQQDADAHYNAEHCGEINALRVHEDVFNRLVVPTNPSLRVVTYGAKKKGAKTVPNWPPTSEGSATLGILKPCGSDCRDSNEDRSGCDKIVEHFRMYEIHPDTVPATGQLGGFEFTLLDTGRHGSKRPKFEPDRKGHVAKPQQLTDVQGACLTPGSADAPEEDDAWQTVGRGGKSKKPKKHGGSSSRSAWRRSIEAIKTFGRAIFRRTAKAKARAGASSKGGHARKGPAADSHSKSKGHSGITSSNINHCLKLKFKDVKSPKGKDKSKDSGHEANTEGHGRGKTKDKTKDKTKGKAKDNTDGKTKTHGAKKPSGSKSRKSH